MFLSVGERSSFVRTPAQVNGAAPARRKAGRRPRTRGCPGASQPRTRPRRSRVGPGRTCPAERARSTPGVDARVRTQLASGRPDRNTAESSPARATRALPLRLRRAGRLALRPREGGRTAKCGTRGAQCSADGTLRCAARGLADRRNQHQSAPAASGRSSDRGRPAQIGGRGADPRARLHGVEALSAEEFRRSEDRPAEEQRSTGGLRPDEEVARFRLRFAHGRPRSGVRQVPPAPRRPEQVHMAANATLTRPYSPLGRAARRIGRASRLLI